MTRYPRWKFFLLLAALTVCGLYALPNLYPDAPAIQISHAEAGGEVDDNADDPDGAYRNRDAATAGWSAPAPVAARAPALVTAAAAAAVAAPSGQTKTPSADARPVSGCRNR